MGEKELDRILDAVMKAKEELIREEATEEERNELIASLREQRKKIIIQEIRQEYKEELIDYVSPYWRALFNMLIGVFI